MPRLLAPVEAREVFHFRGRVTFEQSATQNIHALMVYEKLQLAGELLECQPSATEIELADSIAQLRFVVATGLSAKALKKSLSSAAFVPWRSAYSGLPRRCGKSIRFEYRPR